jgi:hypothetical protein
VNVVAWIVFVVDLLVHMRYIRHYLRTGTGVFDLVVVILTAPWFLIPGFGGTQVLQLARLARLLRIIAVSPSAKRIAQRLGQVGIFAVGMLLFASWAAYIAEHPTNPGFAISATHRGGASSRSRRWVRRHRRRPRPVVAGVPRSPASRRHHPGTLASFFKSVCRRGGIVAGRPPLAPADVVTG